MPLSRSGQSPTEAAPGADESGTREPQRRRSPNLPSAPPRPRPQPRPRPRGPLTEVILVSTGCQTYPRPWKALDSGRLHTRSKASARPTRGVTVTRGAPQAPPGPGATFQAPARPHSPGPAGCARGGKAAPPPPPPPPVLVLGLQRRAVGFPGLGFSPAPRLGLAADSSRAPRRAGPGRLTLLLSVLCFPPPLRQGRSQGGGVAVTACRSAFSLQRRH